MDEGKHNLRDLSLFDRAEMALREAVAEVVEDHRRTGDPLVTWRDGKVVLVPADELIPTTKDHDGIAPNDAPNVASFGAS